MMIFKTSILLIILFFTIGCNSSSFTSTNKVTKNEVEIKRKMDSWLGSHKSELIREWGAPNRYDSDGKGGEILIWEEKRVVGAVMYGVYQQRTLTNYREFFATSAGILYLWRVGQR